ncbi:MAG: Hsp20/alpha crystallin family protein [Chloroflexi bacterium]|nr:Hsp20/alpha crystallin family protein [Chloroflexota bacterium]
MSLMRWDPFRDMESFRERMNRLFDESLALTRSEGGERGRMLFVPVDVVEEGDSYVISAELPGVKPEDIDISVTGNTLTIKGESHEEHEEERGNVHYRERRFGTFSRSVMLPSDVDTSKIDATCDNGILRITAARSEEAKPKRIQVQSGGQPQEIEASASGQSKSKNK